MSASMPKLLIIIFAAAVGTIGLFWSGNISPHNQKGLVSTADAD